MGIFDNVEVPCPECGVIKCFQSKGAYSPSLTTYSLEDVPVDVLTDVNRHSPYECTNCNTAFAVDTRTRTAKKVPQIPNKGIRSFYTLEWSRHFDEIQ